MASVIKGNRPLRIFSALILVVLVVAHFMGSVDLTTPSVLWLMILMGLNAFQASFTGFCPMFKDKDGNCAACGVQCCDSTEDQSKESACCSSDSNCCSETEKK